VKVAHVFNQCNDGWSICKGLRAIGVDAHLWLRYPSNVMALPHWEEVEIDTERLGDLDNPDWKVLGEKWTPPEFVHVWSTTRGRYPLSRTGRFIRFILELGKYDLVVGHSPFARHARCYTMVNRKPYAIYDAGDIRYIDEDTESALGGYRKSRWGYRHASKIFYTNVDTYEIFKEKGFDQESIVYTPFAIDTSLYTKIDVPPMFEGHSPVFFSASRHSWIYKGNDRLVLAFHKYLKRNSKALLMLTDWGPDLSRSKQLVATLGIGQNVKWLPVVSKKTLVKYYNACDALFDQFVYPAFGTLALEAMACQKSVVSYADTSLWEKVHGSVPPMMNASSTEEIYQAMTQLEDSDVRERYGSEARSWIERTCETTVVARLQEQVYSKIIEHGANAAGA